MAFTQRNMVRWSVHFAAVVLLTACTSIQFLNEVSKPRHSHDITTTADYGPRYKIGLPYTIKGITYYPKVDYNHEEVGIASWYGEYFHGRKTANGGVFDMNAVSAAHRTLPLPSFVEVENLENGRTLVVLVNDRGPFHDNRIIDLSKRAAEILGFRDKGIVKVKVNILPEESRHLAALMKSGKKPADVANLRALMSQQKNRLQATAATQHNRTNIDLIPAPDGTVVSIEKIVQAPLKRLKKSPSVNAITPPTNGTYVQIAALSHYQSAVVVRQKLQHFDTTIGLVPNHDGRGNTLYKVLVGPFNTTRAALQAQKQLVQQDFPSAHIISWQS